MELLESIGKIAIYIVGYVVLVMALTDTINKWRLELHSYFRNRKEKADRSRSIAANKEDIKKIVDNTFLPVGANVSHNDTMLINEYEMCTEVTLPDGKLQTAAALRGVLLNVIRDTKQTWEGKRKNSLVNLYSITLTREALTRPGKYICTRVYGSYQDSNDTLKDSALRELLRFARAKDRKITFKFC